MSHQCKDGNLISQLNWPKDEGRKKKNGSNCEGKTFTET